MVSYIISFFLPKTVESTPDDDCLFHIFSYLGKVELGSTIPRTSKHFEAIAKSEHLWKSLYEKEVVDAHLHQNKVVSSWKEALKLRTLWMKGICQKIDLSFMGLSERCDRVEIKNGRMILFKHVTKGTVFEEWDLEQRKQVETWKIDDQDYYYTYPIDILKDQETLVYPVEYQNKNETNNNDATNLYGLKVVKKEFTKIIPLKNLLSNLFFFERYAIACSKGKKEIHIINIDTDQVVDISTSYEEIFLQQENLYIRQDKHNWTVYNLLTSKQSQIQLPCPKDLWVKATVIGNIFVTLREDNLLTGYHIKREKLEQIWQQSFTDESQNIITPSSGSFFGVSYYNPSNHHSIVLHDSITGEGYYKLSYTGSYGINDIRIDGDSIYRLDDWQIRKGHQLNVYKMEMETSTLFKNARKIVSSWLTGNKKHP